jgi:hypothetical protein
MRGTISPLPNTPPWRDARIKDTVTLHKERQERMYEKRRSEIKREKNAIGRQKRRREISCVAL